MSETKQAQHRGKFADRVTKVDASERQHKLAELLSIVEGEARAQAYLDDLQRQKVQEESEIKRLEAVVERVREHQEVK